MVHLFLWKTVEPLLNMCSVLGPLSQLNKGGELRKEEMGGADREGDTQK